MTHPKSKKPKVSKASKPSTTVEDFSDLEEDPGYSASLQFLAKAKKTTKQDKSAINDHARTVELEIERLLNLIDDKARRIISRDRELRSTFNDLLPKAQRRVRLTDTANDKPNMETGNLGRAIYENAQAALTSAGELLKVYRKVNEQVAQAAQEAVRDKSDWESDRQRLQSILYKQGEKAKLEAKRLVMGKVEEEDETVLGEPDEELWSRFAVTSGQEEHEAAKDPERGWAAAAKSARRSVRRMLKDVSEEGE